MHEIEPHGLLWDRDLWYLVGRSLEADEIRMWRADRVLSIKVTGMAFRPGVGLRHPRAARPAVAGARDAHLG